MYRVHWIFKDQLLMVTRPAHIPDVGDEIRVSEVKFYKVKRRVWCMDEELANAAGTRVNIELVKVKI